MVVLYKCLLKTFLLTMLLILFFQTVAPCHMKIVPYSIRLCQMIVNRKIKPHHITQKLLQWLCHNTYMITNGSTRLYIELRKIRRIVVEPGTKSITLS